MNLIPLSLSNLQGVKSVTSEYMFCSTTVLFVLNRSCDIRNHSVYVRSKPLYLGCYESRITVVISKIPRSPVTVRSVREVSFSVNDVEHGDGVSSCVL